MPVIDPVSLEKMIAGDKQLLADLATLFVQLLPDMEARLQMANKNHEVDEIDFVAHQLRSRVAYFGANSLVQVARQLETAARSRDHDAIDAHLSELLDGIDQLLQELRVATQLPLEVGLD